MFCRSAIILLSAICALPALSLKVGNSDPCPFGYGKGCNGVDPNPATTDESGEHPASGTIDKATRDKVADIIGGILTNLSRHKDLVQVGRALSKATVSEQTVQANTMSTKVAEVLSGYLKNVQNAAAGKALAKMLAAAAPKDAACSYYGVCGLAAADDHPIDSQTKEQVANILEGILGNLQSHKVF